jgi:hypothetical protein
MLYIRQHIHSYDKREIRELQTQFHWPVNKVDAISVFYLSRSRRIFAKKFNIHEAKWKRHPER